MATTGSRASQQVPFSRVFASRSDRSSKCCSSLLTGEPLCLPSKKLPLRSATPSLATPLWPGCGISGTPASAGLMKYKQHQDRVSVVPARLLRLQGLGWQAQVSLGTTGSWPTNPWDGIIADAACGRPLPWWACVLGDIPNNRCNAATLIPLTQRHVVPGTTIMSDQWAVYNSLPAHQCNHLTVNHSLYFVDRGEHSDHRVPVVSI